MQNRRHDSGPEKGNERLPSTRPKLFESISERFRFIDQQRKSFPKVIHVLRELVTQTVEPPPVAVVLELEEAQERLARKLANIRGGEGRPVARDHRRLGRDHLIEVSGVPDLVRRRF